VSAPKGIPLQGGAEVREKQEMGKEKVREKENIN